jgi:hypothetical protein
VGWKQFVRQAQVATRRPEGEPHVSAKRSERPAMARHRQLIRLHREHDQETVLPQATLALQAAALEAEEYANYVAMLVSVHVDCSEPWDWRAIATSQPPLEPAKRNPAETFVRAALPAFTPGLFGELLGGAARQHLLLEQAVQRGFAIDHQHHEAAMNEHRIRLTLWSYQVKLAPGVLRLDLEACRSALWYVGAFDELEGFGTRVTLDAVAGTTAAFTCRIEDPEIVPVEQIELTADGQQTRKELAPDTYWALYREHVASCAIRIAREALAITPIERVIVNVQVAPLDPRTGHREAPAVLAVQFARDELARLEVAALDPSNVVQRFPHRSKRRSTGGFDPVDGMTPDEP